MAGWAGPGYLELTDGNEKLLVGEELGTLSVSGNFVRRDDSALPASTTLYLYLHNENSESDFVRGEGVIDPTTGNFTAVITAIPVGYSRGILSFVVLDPADAGQGNYHDDTVFDVRIVNEGCSDALRTKLEWESTENIDLLVTDPTGDSVVYYSPDTVGVHIDLCRFFEGGVVQSKSPSKNKLNFLRLDSLSNSVCVLP